MAIRCNDVVPLFLRGSSPIHFSADARDPLHDETVELSNHQTGISNEPVDSAIQVTAATDQILKRIQSILP